MKRKCVFREMFLRERYLRKRVHACSGVLVAFSFWTLLIKRTAGALLCSVPLAILLRTDLRKRDTKLL